MNKKLRIDLDELYQEEYDEDDYNAEHSETGGQG